MTESLRATLPIPNKSLLFVNLESKSDSLSTDVF